MRFCAWILAGGLVCVGMAGAAELATFVVDVTPPVGHACMGGGIPPVKSVKERLEARGFVLMGMGKPIVVVSFDWCEIRGSAFDDWRAALAEVTGSEPERILISSTHVHDAPVMDPEAERLLRATEASGAWKDLAPVAPDDPIQLASVCWPDFNRLCIQQAKAAVKDALKRPRSVTSLGTGRAKVKDVGSNRRFVLPDGKVSYARGSRNIDPLAKAADEGDIDPWLRTLSFWEGDRLVCALHSYATHPMSVYGDGVVDYDFVGRARAALQAQQPEAFHLYATGCGGNVTAGKYNEGSPESAARLAAALQQAMEEALRDTVKHPLTQADVRVVKIPLGHRQTIGFTEDSLQHRLQQEVKAFDRAEAAMGLAWYERVKSGHKVDLPVIDFGPAQLLLFPAEIYVEYQLFAQSLRPESFVMVMGYGECGPGYIPIERA